jgi:hypothetical protein
MRQKADVDGAECEEANEIGLEKEEDARDESAEGVGGKEGPESGERKKAEGGVFDAAGEADEEGMENCEKRPGFRKSFGVVGQKK